ELAHEYRGERPVVELHDLNRDARDGLHIAAMAGAWSGLVAGFGGMRAGDGRLRFAPRLPGGSSRLAFRRLYRGNRVKVTVTSEPARYELMDGPGPKLWHPGEPCTLGGEPD